ncbi:MAG TPA: saccharopine dehydrogenase C-terminal domain-containing protein [Anaerolineae bacterium]|nr:saccharopine dehydrogenase C-terminal domain-containing protein [Anaerolineae bacterium]
MSIQYLVVGAGRQGTASAYDLAKFGGAERVTLADVDRSIAQAAADRVNQLLGRSIAQAIELDVKDDQAVRQAAQGCTVMLSAVPYFFNLNLTKIAIECGVSFCDLGGNTEIVRQQHALDAQAKRAGVTVVADCGMGPGLGNTLAVYAMELLDQTDHIYLYDGGLPLEPQAPWNYVESFNLEGLTNEYHDGLMVLRNGELEFIPPFSEMEIIDFPPLGKLEAFIVAGGLSTTPWTFKGKLKTLQLKILRYPGTFAQLKAYSDLGLYDFKPINVDGVNIIPRRVFHTLYGPRVHADTVQDICLIRAHAIGQKDGRPAEALIDLIDRYDPHTGFSSMERTTGWHLSIVAAMIAHQQIAAGAVPLELAVPGHAFVAEAKIRGFKIKAKVTTTQAKSKKRPQ